MNILDKNKPIGIWVMSPERDISRNKGSVPIYNNAKMNLRFASTSELFFETPERYYDSRSESFVSNPIYKDLIKGNTLYTDWENEIYSLPVCEYPSSRDDFEVEAFDTTPIGASISESTLYGGVLYVDSGCATGAPGRDIGCLYSSDFYKAEKGDKLVVMTYDGNAHYGYRVFCYAEQNESTVYGYQGGCGDLREYIFPSNDLDYSDNKKYSSTPTSTTHSVFTIEKDCYVRVCWSRTSAGKPTGSLAYILPGVVSFKKMSNIKKLNTNNVLSQQYWVISDVETTYEDGVFSKQVTAKSYEYALKNRYVPNEENEVINLYTPDVVKNYVQYKQIEIDGNDYITGLKLRNEGLLNRIADCTGWKIGYVSESLITKYRTFESEGLNNAYSLLTKDIPSMYKCFIIFDTKNMIIHALTKEELITKSDLVASYNNIIKSSHIDTQDNDIVTALKVHTADDTYSVGLVNPLGGDMIYNFGFYKDEFKNINVVSDKDPDSPTETLWDYVDKWTIAIDNNMGRYLTDAKNLIKSNKIIMERKTTMDDLLSQYSAKIKAANMSKGLNTKSLPEGYVVSSSYLESLDYAENSDDLLSRDVCYFRSKSARDEIVGLAKTYESNVAVYKENLKIYNQSLNDMKDISQSLQMSKWFSDDALNILNFYIREGSWKDEYATFSDTYSADDIYTTLKDVYDTSSNDLSSFISQPNFDVNVDLIDFMHISNYANLVKTTFLGNTITTEIHRGEWFEPVLLEVCIDISNIENTNITLTTDYKRKTASMRFQDLYDSLPSISVSDNSFNYTAED